MYRPSDVDLNINEKTENVFNITSESLSDKSFLIDAIPFPSVNHGIIRELKGKIFKMFDVFQCYY